MLTKKQLAEVGKGFGPLPLKELEYILIHVKISTDTYISDFTNYICKDRLYHQAKQLQSIGAIKNLVINRHVGSVSGDITKFGLKLLQLSGY